ncbi:hypothetical protein AWZ03_014342 [Drosophila navojoa]|uniref:Uncharacterized protein n=1 Tax=Drosophila navojoa TaxID=7232 RepID=A0A484AUL1_DRONA|nr:uncharacterized protein LOC115565274 [Drosophila navojoa]TDG39235.1 hypothetical protein AWZ03_014342 [Drosophila navojoa]
MPQRPRLKVPHYGMGRRSSIVTMLQTIRPCIVEYAYFWDTKKNEENAGVGEILSGSGTEDKEMTAEPQMPAKANKINVKVVPARNIREDCLKHGSKQHLPTIAAVSKVSKDCIDSSNQTEKKEFNIIDDDLKLLLPFNRYIDDKLSKYNLPKLIADLTKNMVEIEVINMRPQYVTIIPEPRVAWRIEIDLSSNPSIQCLIRAGIYIKEAMDNDPQALLMLNGYDQDNHHIALAAVHDQMPPAGDDNMRRPATWMARIPLFWPHIPNRLAKIVLTYFILICVIGIVFTFFL